jgi:subfamily B ATP-binding cassette protein MsbA
MHHLKEKSVDKTKKKPKVTIGKAFKTIIWPRRNLVFIGLLLIILRSLAGLILPWQSKVYWMRLFLKKILVNYTV